MTNGAFVSFERRKVPVRSCMYWSGFITRRARAESLSPSKSPPMPCIGAFDTRMMPSPRPAFGSVSERRELSSEICGRNSCTEFGLSVGDLCRIEVIANASSTRACIGTGDVPFAIACWASASSMTFQASCSAWFRLSTMVAWVTSSVASS